MIVREGVNRDQSQERQVGVIKFALLNIVSKECEAAQICTMETVMNGILYVVTLIGDFLGVLLEILVYKYPMA